MKFEVISEYGDVEAFFGMGLSWGKTSRLRGVYNDEGKHSWSDKTNDELIDRAYALAGMGGGHDKFLRMIVVYLDITAPLYWWKQFDTYKVGTVAQSESTMHTLMKKPITPEMFEGGQADCEPLEALRVAGDFDSLNARLPQSFLQRRIVMCNYAVLGNILSQRRGHKLKEWKTFCDNVVNGVEWPEFFKDKKEA